MRDINEKSCKYCGTVFEKQLVYCPECGKLIVTPRTGSVVSKKDQYLRKCNGCGSLIESAALEQCPICNEQIEQVLEESSVSSTSQVGYVFDSKKLRMETNKYNWNFKEGAKVFQSALLAYITVYILVLLLLNDPSAQSSEMTIFSLILQVIPHISMIIYPLLYVMSRKDKYSKLGFDSKGTKLGLIFLFTLVGTVILLIFSFSYDFLIENLQRMGLSGFIEYSTSSSLVRDIIRTSGIWFIFYYALSILSIISIEIAYRGVLHNALRDVFGPELKGKCKAIAIVAAIFACIESLLFFLTDLLLGMVFFVYYLIFFLILGTLYELKGKIYNTLIIHVVFNVITIIVFVFF